MSQRKPSPGVLGVVLPLVAVFVGYDFWRGYQHRGDIFEGIVYAILGCGVVVFLWVVFRPGEE